MKDEGWMSEHTSWTSGLQHFPGTPTGSQSVRTFGHCVKIVIAVTRFMTMVWPPKKRRKARRGFVVPKSRQRRIMKEIRPEAELRIPKRIL
jgi:hypothetical protein